MEVRGGTVLVSMEGEFSRQGWSSVSLTEYERGISQVLWVLNLFPEFINCPH